MRWTHLSLLPTGFSVEVKKSKFKATQKMAWNFWIQALTGVFKRRGLDGVGKGQRRELKFRPSPFVKIIWELELQLPNGIVRRSATELGLSNAIVRARKADVEPLERFLWPEIRLLWVKYYQKKSSQKAHQAN